MELNEVKKALYREKPLAKETDDGISGIRGATANPVSSYKAFLADGTGVLFCVPHLEMGAEKFEKEIPAQLLIRWIELSFTP